MSLGVAGWTYFNQIQCALQQMCLIWSLISWWRGGHRQGLLNIKLVSLIAVTAAASCFCRFNWADEAARAKHLVAAGELVLEDEEPFDSPSHTYIESYHDNNDGSSGGGIYNSGGDGDFSPSDVSGASRRTGSVTARADKAGVIGYQSSKSSPVELSRLLPWCIVTSLPRMSHCIRSMTARWVRKRVLLFVVCSGIAAGNVLALQPKASMVLHTGFMDTGYCTFRLWNTRRKKDGRIAMEYGISHHKLKACRSSGVIQQ